VSEQSTMTECNEYESDQMPLWYTCGLSTQEEEEAIEAQLTIEWFEYDRKASIQYLENMLGKNIYLPVPQFCFLSNTVASI